MELKPIWKKEGMKGMQMRYPKYQNLKHRESVLIMMKEILIK